MSSAYSRPSDGGIRVLRVVGGLDTRGGGPTVSSVGSIVAQAERGSAVTVAVALESDDFASDSLAALRAARVTVLTFHRSRIARSTAKRLGISPGLIRFLLFNVRSFDVVHAHGAWMLSSLVALTAAKLWGRPFLLTPHETFTGFDLSKVSPVRRLAKRIIRRGYLVCSTRIIVSSELELADSIPERFRWKCVVIGHPVRHRDGGRPAGATREAGTLTVGYLGRFDPKKNLDLLIRAIAACAPNTRLEIAGGGDAVLHADLQQLVTDLGAADRIDWVGFVDGADKDRFLARIDILAMPSAYECFGMAAGEAIAAGTPVLVGRQTGIAAIVDRHGCGLVVDASAANIAKALSRLAADPDLVETLRDRTQLAEAHDLSPEIHGVRLEAALASCVAPRNTSPGRRREKERPA